MGYARRGRFVLSVTSGAAGEQAVTVRDAITGETVPAEVVQNRGGVWDFTLPKHGFRQSYTATRYFVAFEATVPATGHRVYDVKYSGSPSKETVRACRAGRAARICPCPSAERQRPDGERLLQGRGG